MTHKSTALILATILTLTAPGAALAQDGEIITKQYDGGGIYEGTFLDGKQHGTGTYRLPNGYAYTGEWVAGEIRGTGTAEFPDGSVYTGTFARGKP